MGMHKYLLSALLVLVSLGCSSLPVMDPIESLQEAPATVWALETPMASGSGVAISCVRQDSGNYEVLMLTAKHVVKEYDVYPTFMVVAHLGDRQMPGFVTMVHPDLDIAKVLLFTHEPVAVAEIDHDPVVQLEYLYSMGYSGGRHEIWIAEGLACGDGRTTCASAPGDSGGPVFNSIGRLIGITRAIDGMRNGALVWHHVHYVPMEGLEDWLATELAPEPLVPMPRVP